MALSNTATIEFTTTTHAHAAHSGPKGPHDPMASLLRALQLVSVRAKRITSILKDPDGRQAFADLSGRIDSWLATRDSLHTPARLVLAGHALLAYYGHRLPSSSIRAMDAYLTSSERSLRALGVKLWELV